ncbi:hypothetical protein JYU34_014211 [Plutella xylostella]|uniref:Uncharacterized protein n=1 Tax=Plutella xylostella TaxID=51655 RepID=A0ABQ7Q7T7_PLUXY|nr:hypothetical protein JYU34_014211 [Plutella xylostella]
MGDSSVQIAQTISKESTQSNRKVSSVQLLRSQTKVSSVRLETSKTQVCCNVCDETEQKPTSSKSLAHRLSHSDALALERQHRSNCSCTSSRPAVSVHSKLLIGKMASDRRNRNAKKRQPARRSCRVVKKRRPMKRSSRYRKCDLPRPLVLQHHSRSFQSLVSSATTVSSYDGCRFCGHRCCRK